jgi:hypothetical protein
MTMAACLPPRGHVARPQVGIAGPPDTIRCSRWVPGEAEPDRRAARGSRPTTGVMPSPPGAGRPSMGRDPRADRIVPPRHACTRHRSMDPDRQQTSALPSQKSKPGPSAGIAGSPRSGPPDEPGDWLPRSRGGPGIPTHSQRHTFPPRSMTSVHGPGSPGRPSRPAVQSLPSRSVRSCDGELLRDHLRDLDIHRNPDRYII